MARFQMLALSGGGYLGLYTAHILAALEARAKRPLASCFDLICGTSIGGILALGLAHEVSTAEMVKAFEEGGEKIFSDRPPPQTATGQFLDLRRYAFKPKYSADPLRAVVDSLLGSETLLGDAKHRVVIPALNMTTGSPQMFKTPHHTSLSEDRNRKSVDIGLATSAAPMLFPLAEVNNALFADGGLFANAPDMIGLHEARHFLGQTTDDVHILSVGTTTSSMSLAHATGRDFGIANWIAGQRLISAVISAQQQSVDFMLRHELGDRYQRIDTMQSREQERQLGLDVANAAARATIAGLAGAAAQKALGNSRVTAFLEHQAPAVEWSHHG